MTDKELLTELAEFNLTEMKKISADEFLQLKDDPDVYVQHNFIGDEDIYRKATFDDSKINQKILLRIFKNTRTVKNIIVFYFVCSIILGVIGGVAILANL